MLIFVTVCAILTLGLANALPAYDLSVSSLFCGHAQHQGPNNLRIEVCTGFPAASNHAMRFIRTTLFYIPPIAFIALLLELARSGIFRTKVNAEVVWHQIHAAAAYLAGPILLVNVVLKSMSGRPRPYESLPFGGKLPFVPAGDFSGACQSNCSFVSGEAAAAGWLLCLLPLVSGRYRRPLRSLLVLVSLVTPVLRVAMGGHFVSDVVLGWLAGASAYPVVVVAGAIIGPLTKGQTYRTT